MKFKSDIQVLTDDQSKWVNESTDQVYSLIDETPPNGPEFSKAVKHILKREEQWNAWKNDGCPSFGKDLSKSQSANKGTEEGVKDDTATPQKCKYRTKMLL